LATNCTAGCTAANNPSKTTGNTQFAFYWQKGYGIFSVSSSHADAVAAYIGNQKVRHAAVTFQEEFRHLLAKNGVDFDERYVWD
jgi:hypothetical protein